MLNRFKKLTVATKLFASFSAIIIIFIASLIYAWVSYSDLDSLHRHRFEHVAAGTENLLEFHQQFTEFSLHLRNTFLAIRWIEAAGEEQWLAAGQELSNIQQNLQGLHYSYIDQVQRDPLLSDADTVTRVETMRGMMDHVNIIYNLFDDEFRRRVYSADGFEPIFETEARVLLFAASIENSLQLLREFVDRVNYEALKYIDETVNETLALIVTAVLSAVAIAALLALLMVRTVAKMAIEKTREAEEINRAMIEAEPSAVMMWEKLTDGTYKIFDCNTQALNMFGVTEKETLMNNFFDFCPLYQSSGELTADVSREFMNIAYEQGSYRAEWLHQAADGRLFPADIALARQQYRGKEIIISYCDDISTLKSAIEKEQEEIILRKSAEEENRAKTKFLARMSHEIRTPMNAVMGITEIQLQKEGHPQDTEEAFLRIYSSSSLLLAIINDILDLSKVEAGKMEIVEDTYELASLIVDTVQLNLMHVGSKQIDFKLHVDEKLPAYLIGDEMRIRQILNNLLSNAFKYTYEGYVDLSITMEAGLEPKHLTIIFRVEDSGQGMTQEQIDGLFEIEFTRFNMQSNRAIEGSGLGMSIAHQLIKMMGGDIEVESIPEKGSVFTVRIPQKIKGTDLVGIDVAKNLENLEITQKELKRVSKLKRLPMPYGKVLVVDDVESNLFVAKGLLLPYKLTVETVDSGKAAISKVEAGIEYDIIFMDHMMPEMDGIEAVKIIRGKGYNKPIIALTANTVRGQADVFMENGFSGFVSKPIDVNYLNAVLLRFIRDAHPEEAKLYDEAETDDLGKTEISEADAAQMRDAFILDAKKALESIAPFTQRNILLTYITGTHGIKSALNNIGEAEMSEKALALEQAGKVIRDQTTEFVNELENLVENLTPNADAADESEEDTQKIRASLKIIAAACRDYDIDTAEEALKALRKFPCSKNTITLLNSIFEKLLLGDYEEAAKLAESY